MMWSRGISFSYSTEERRYQQIIDDIDKIREQQRDLRDMELSEEITTAAIAELEAKIAVLKLELVACASEY